MALAADGALAQAPHILPPEARFLFFWGKHLCILGARVPGKKKNVRCPKYILPGGGVLRIENRLHFLAAVAA